jgi:hypothetical protein
VDNLKRGDELMSRSDWVPVDIAAQVVGVPEKVVWVWVRTGIVPVQRARLTWADGRIRMAFVELEAVKEKAQDPLWVRATQRVAKGPLVTSWRMRWRLAAALLMEMGYLTERQVAEMMRRVSVRHLWRGFNRVRLGRWEFVVPDDRFQAFLALKDREERKRWLKEGGTVLEVTADEVLAAPEAFLARAKGGREGDAAESGESSEPIIERLEARSLRWEEDGAVAVLVFRPQDEEGDA